MKHGLLHGCRDVPTREPIQLTTGLSLVGLKKNSVFPKVV